MIIDVEVDQTAVVDRLVRWANADDDVRALMLTSSRASPSAAVDTLSDYDVVVVLRDIASATADESWLREYGTPLVQFRDRAELHGIATATRLVLYEDGTKIDYQVWPAGLLRRLAIEPRLPDNLDVGYVVLVDKDNLTEQLKAPSYAAHIPKRPTESEFLDVVEEFWWESQYLAKALWRDELLPAKYSFDVVMKLNLLRRMLEWLVELDRDWSIRPGRMGRELKARLDPELWPEVEVTFVGSSIDENWDALFRCTALFGKVARSVAAGLGYHYPDDMESAMTRYLKRVQELEHE